MKAVPDNVSGFGADIETRGLFGAVVRLAGFSDFIRLSVGDAAFVRNNGRFVFVVDDDLLWQLLNRSAPTVEAASSRVPVFANESENSDIESVLQQLKREDMPATIPPPGWANFFRRVHMVSGTWPRGSGAGGRSRWGALYELTSMGATQFGTLDRSDWRALRLPDNEVETIKHELQRAPHRKEYDREFLEARLLPNKLMATDAVEADIHAAAGAIRANRHLLARKISSVRTLFLSNSAPIVEAVRCYWRMRFPLVQGEWWPLNALAGSEPFPLRLPRYVPPPGVRLDDDQFRRLREFVDAVSPAIRTIAKAFDHRIPNDVPQLADQLERHPQILQDAFDQMAVLEDTHFRLFRGQDADVAAAQQALARLDGQLVQLANSDRPPLRAIRLPAEDRTGVEHALLACSYGLGPVRMAKDSLDLVFGPKRHTTDIDRAVRRLLATRHSQIDDPRIEQRYEHLLAWAAVCACRGDRALAGAACSSAMYLPVPATAPADRRAILKSRSEAFVLRARLIRRDLQRSANPYAAALFAYYCIQTAIEAHQATPQNCSIDVLRYYRERAALRMETYLVYSRKPAFVHLRDQALSLALHELGPAYWLTDNILDEDLTKVDMTTPESLKLAMIDCEVVCENDKIEGDYYLRALNYQLKLLIDHCIEDGKEDRRTYLHFTRPSEQEFRQRLRNKRGDRFRDIQSSVSDIIQHYEFRNPSEFPRTCPLTVLIGQYLRPRLCYAADYLSGVGIANEEEAYRRLAALPATEADMIFEETKSWAERVLPFASEGKVRATA